MLIETLVDTFPNLFEDVVILLFLFYFIDFFVISAELIRRFLFFNFYNDYLLFLDELNRLIKLYRLYFEFTF